MIGCLLLDGDRQARRCSPTALESSHTPPGSLSGLVLVTVAANGGVHDVGRTHSRGDRRAVCFRARYRRRRPPARPPRRLGGKRKRHAHRPRGALLGTEERTQRDRGSPRTDRGGAWAWAGRARSPYAAQAGVHTQSCAHREGHRGLPARLCTPVTQCIAPR